MLLTDRKGIFATVAVGVLSLTVCASLALAGQCSGSKKLGMSWTERSATIRISLSGSGCATVPACVSGVADGGLTTPPFTLSIVDALGQTFETTLDVEDPLCDKLCMSVQRGTCRGGTDTYWGAGGTRLRYSFGAGGEVILMGTKFKVPSLTSPAITAPVTVTLTDANGYTLVMKPATCLSRQRLGSWSAKCY